MTHAARRTSVTLSLLAVLLAASARAAHARADAESMMAAFRAGRYADAERLARERVSEDPDDLRARVVLSVSLAHLGRSEECARELIALREAGRDPDSDFPGLGTPLALVVEALWDKTWADFDPERNRALWGPIFAAFPDSRFAPVPARRVLMAALALRDAEEAERLDRWFEERIEAAPERRVEWLAHRLRAWLRARRANEHVLSWALEVYRARRAAALSRLGIEVDEDGSLDERALDPQVRDALDLEIDDAYSDLALAAHLAGRPGALAFREAETEVRFEDVTDEAGLGGVRRTRVAAADVDGDGAVDLCFQGVLFVRRGDCFEDVTEQAGLAPGGNGALLADLDGDGRTDVLVAAAAPKLFRQAKPSRDHTPRFVDATKKAGLASIRAEAGVEGAALFDLDSDGDLDVYFAVYENPLGVGHPDLVLRNDGGRFTDVSEEAGARSVGPFCGRGVTCTDLDDDGDSDVFVSNYRLQRNVLWRNEGGRLRDVAEQAGVAGVEQQGSFGHTIGSAFGDVDGDGDLDLFCANLAHPRFVAQGFSNLSQLLVRTGVGDDEVPHFVDERRERGVRFQETQSDPAFVDVDSDGDLDLSLTCVYEGVPSALLANDGRGRFEPITLTSGAVVFHGWGQAWFDLEGDGDPDVCYASQSGVRLLRNETPGGRFLRVELRPREGPWRGIGARVTVIDPSDAERRIVRELRVGRGTTSQDEPVALFGLGDAKGRVRVEVRWSDGRVRRLASLLDRSVRVTR